MNKKLAILLVITLSATILLGGCSDISGEGDTLTSEPSSETTAPAESASSVETTQPADEEKEIVTLEYYNALTSGLQENTWWTNKLLDDLSVKFNMTTADVTLFNTYLASRDVPDLIYLNNPQQIENILNAGLVVDLDDYADVIPNLYANCTAESVQYKRDSWGGLYAAPQDSTYESDEYNGLNYAMFINWPYFYEYIEEFGYPELNEIADFLPVLQWMQEQHPTNEDGQSVYALSFMQGWSDLNPTLLYIAHAMDFMETESIGYSIEVDLSDLSYVSRYTKDSFFYEILQFLFEANHLGILDPDMVNMNYADYTAKVAAGRVLCYPAWANNADYRCIPYTNMQSRDYTGPVYLGEYTGNAGLFVSNTGENIDRAVEFINYMFDYDNVLYLKYGPQDEGWAINDKGNAYLTETWAEWLADSYISIEGGSNPVADNIFNCLNWGSISLRNTHPTLGITLDSSAWAASPGVGKTDLQLSYESVMKDEYGVSRDDNDVTNTMTAKAAGGFATYCLLKYAGGSEMNEMMSSLPSQEVLIQAIYSDSEDEFNSIWEQWCEDCHEVMEGLGWSEEKVYEEFLAEYNKIIKYQN